MSDEFNGDSLLKAITVIILGVLGFGFAFNVMFGRPAGGMEGMHSGGYALDNTLAYVIVLLVQALLITGLVMAVIAFIKTIGNYFFNNKEKTMADTIKSDAIIKIVALSALVVLVFALAWPLLQGQFGMNTGYGMGTNYGMRTNDGRMNMYYTNTSYTLTGVLVFLIKLLLILAVVGLVVGISVYAWQNVTKLTANTQATAAPQCAHCGKTLQANWKWCPDCGKETSPTPTAP